MDRRQEIESIIIGTLLNSDNDTDYIRSCKSCVTADMFKDERHSAIFSAIMRMSNSGIKSINPLDVVKYDKSMMELAYYMCHLSIDYHFEYKKVVYNENQYLYCERPKYTTVKFDDYISRLVSFAFGG